MHLNDTTNKLQAENLPTIKNKRPSAEARVLSQSSTPQEILLQENNNLTLF
jgi:hypothetical protein